MNAANDSLRVIGIGRVRDDPKALELNLTGRPSDDDMRRIHDLLRDGRATNDDALWGMLVRQAHERLGIGPDPGESPFDYLQRALQRIRPYGVPASEYLAKIEADPRRAAALQRARDRAPGVAERHPRCGYPYCACVGECFAASQPGVTDGVLGTSADQSKG